MESKINLLELATRESDAIEWKENVADERKLIETIVAFTNDFLNLGGGYIVCGAKEIVDIHGFKSVEYVGLTASNLEKLKKFISDTCYNPTKVNPPIIPKFDEINLPNDASKRVLVITVDATSNAHTYKADNDNRPRHFVRTDANTRAATNGIERELLRRKGQLEPWDRRLNPKAKIEDIDVLILRQYLQTMRLWSPNKSVTDYVSDKEKIEQFIPPLLGSVGIDKPLHPKNFTLMVFGEKPIDFCVGAYSIFTIFEGKNKGTQRAETLWITGTIVEQANKLIELLNIESSIAIDKSTENANQIKYPKIALKEAIVNAIVHRDYEIDQPTRVEVYSDRVEIYSPGGLTHDIDKNKFKEGNAKASWRNQSFARIFDRLNLAQHQGSGIGKIISAMQEEGCPMPIFEVDNNSITCILPAHPRHRIMRQLSDVESDIVIKNYLSAFKKTNEVLQEDVYNYRALELFCEVNNLLGSPENILNLLLSKNIDFSLIRPNTLVIISESLSLIKNNKKAETLSKELLMIAASRRLEESQLVKIAYTLKKLGDDKAVVDFVDTTLLKYANLSTNALLLDQKGRALIDLANKCEDTFNDQNVTDRIKNKAKEDFEVYIQEAQKALSIAYENSDSIVDKEHIEKALTYIKTKLSLTKPTNDPQNTRR
jgi:predicted HTH transcriptional regulator